MATIFSGMFYDKFINFHYFIYWKFYKKKKNVINFTGILYII